MIPRITQNAPAEPSPGKWTFIPNVEAMSVSGRMIDAERGEHAQDVVDPVREHRLVRRLEALDDLLEVLEHVPDALGRVVDVVEVDVEVLGDVALRALEVLERGALRADDLAEVDDLLLGVRDVANDLRGAALEDVLLDALELVPDLAQHRERGVDALVDDLVEQVAARPCENSCSRSSAFARQRSKRYSSGWSGSLGSVMTKSGPTKRSSSAAFRRSTVLSKRGKCRTTKR